ncbi:unnamed protein product [Prunus armeniaca]|uniref:Uncharacterized protein n=1 Tax=Prunus armeniaca TaxID=36596 RepID=A0A6J5UY33_PRUAR|nr:unnamed protein product [Prunus armeniaca]
MASGSSGRANPSTQGFDFVSDDILCSYEDYGNQDSSNGNHSDPVMGNNPSKVLLLLSSMDVIVRLWFWRLHASMSGF